MEGDKSVGREGRKTEVDIGISREGRRPEWTPQGEGVLRWDSLAKDLDICMMVVSGLELGEE